MATHDRRNAHQKKSWRKNFRLGAQREDCAQAMRGKAAKSELSRANHSCQAARGSSQRNEFYLNGKFPLAITLAPQFLPE